METSLRGCQSKDLLQPVLDSEPTDRLKILIGGEENQLVLASHRCSEQVELCQHSAGQSKLAKNLREFCRRVFVGGPEPEYPQRGLKTGQVLLIAPAYADTGPVLAMDRQTNPETVAAPQSGINPWLQHRVAVEIG
jgi:hypothetical protein